MRIGILCHNYPPHPGGLEIMVQSLARGLADHHDVTVVSSAWESTRGVSHEDGLTVHRLPAVHASEPWGVPYPVPIGPGVVRALDSLRSADILHVHGALYPTTLLARLLHLLSGPPLVLTEHVGFVVYKRPELNAIESTAWKFIGDRVVRRANAVVAYNARVKAWLEQRFPGKQIEYIANGVASETFRPASEDERRAARERLKLPRAEFLVLCAARQAEKKNLSAVLDIPRDGFTLVVCGAPRNLREPGVVDLGVVPHIRMPELYAACDLMVHASTGEGFPLALQEGMSAGLPEIVLWDEGYGSALSRDVVFACDTIEEIGPAVRALRSDETRRRQLAAAARAWAVEHWSWDATVRAYETVYARLIDSAERRTNSSGQSIWYRRFTR